METLLPEDIKKYTELYHKVDKEFGKGNGALNIGEFDKLMDMCGIPMPRPLIGATFVEADENKDWRISLDEFLKEMAYLTEPDPKRFAQHKFRELDADEDGLLSYEDVKDFLFEHLPGLGDDLMKTFFDASDKDNDGKIDMYQFSLIFIPFAMPGKRNLTDPEVSDNSLGDKIRQIFKEADSDNDGLVGVKDLKEFRRQAFPEYTKRDFKLLIDLYDDDGDGKISLGEFVSMYMQDVLPFSQGEYAGERRTSGILINDKVRHKFDQADVDGDGFLTKNDVMRLILTTFPHLKEEELNKEFFSGCDSNSDGKISYDEFIPMFLFHLRPECYYDSDSEDDEEEDEETTDWKQHLEEGNKKREERENKLRQTFEKSDLNKDGMLTFEELTDFMKENLPKADEGQLKTYFESWDDDGDGKINFLEFIPMFIDMVWIDSDDED